MRRMREKARKAEEAGEDTFSARLNRHHIRTLLVPAQRAQHRSRLSRGLHGNTGREGVYGKKVFLLTGPEAGKEKYYPFHPVQSSWR